MVLAMSSLTSFAVIRGLRPGRGASFSRPASPSWRYLFRHRRLLRSKIQLGSDLFVAAASGSQQHDSRPFNQVGRGLTWRDQKTEWGDYYSDTNYTEQALQERKA